MVSDKHSTNKIIRILDFFFDYYVISEMNNSSWCLFHFCIISLFISFVNICRQYRLINLRMFFFGFSCMIIWNTFRWYLLGLLFFMIIPFFPEVFFRILWELNFKMLWAEDSENFPTIFFWQKFFFLVKHLLKILILEN